MMKSARFTLLGILFLISCQAGGGESTAPKIRPSVLAGSWYVKDPSILTGQLDQFLAKAPDSVAGSYPVRALIAPHAGYQWSGPTAAYAYKSLKGASYKRVIVLGPSHNPYYQDGVPTIVHGGVITDVDAYETPLGKVQLDQETCKKLIQSNPLIKRLSLQEDREHSLEIQLPFLQRMLGEFTLIPIMIGEISPSDCEKLADSIRPLLDNSTLLVMSSDFTHQGPRFRYTPFKKDIKENIQRLDFTAVNNILNLNVWGFWSFCEKIQSTICGNNPIKIGLMALPLKTQVEFVHYETSGDKLQDYTETVSYCAIVFRERPDYLDEKETALLLQTARKTLEQTFTDGKPKEFAPPAADLTPRLQEKKAVFVTLQEEGQLRGCIGQLEARDQLYKAVSSTVLLSALADRRFNPLQKNELNKVEIEISVMTPFKEIASWKEIVLGRDGMTLEKNGRSALFLPQVALEQGWNVEETLSHLCEKAGLNKDDYKSGCKFKTFTAQVFGETFKNLKAEAK